MLTGSDVATALRELGIGATTTEWAMNLRLLGVVDSTGRLDSARAEAVATALELVANSFDPIRTEPSWALVATLPTELRRLLRPPPLRQTAGVLVELLDRARSEARLAAPFVDQPAVAFLSDAILGAGSRGAEIRIVTSVGHGGLFDNLGHRWREEPRARLRVTEVHTDLSSLGSHAKVLVVDDERGYVGSANLTAAGFGRHVEIGVELAGPQIAELSAVLDALERVGVVVYEVA